MNKKSPFFHWQQPEPHNVGDSLHQFLHQLKQPTLITQKGIDHSRCRLVVTLLHGNEPSGLSAIWHWLKSGQKPAVDSYYFVGAVNAAQEDPEFALRHFLHLRDLNRCFDGPFHDEPGAIAHALLQLMREQQPEAVLDIHNTSGSGPSFAVSFSKSPKHIALCSLFTERLLLTQTRLGALMEKTSEAIPIVTIECGGAIDPESERVAIEGVNRFLNQPEVLAESEHDWQMEILTDPIRVTLTSDASIAYAEQPDSSASLTLPPDIEHLNFGRIQANTQLGHLVESLPLCTQAVDSKGVVRTKALFKVKGNKLFNRIGLKIFMITTNPSIAVSDCLCYVVVDDENND